MNKEERDRLANKGIGRYGHLTNNIPNNFFFRWLITKANKHMNRCYSVWRLRIRYRKPKKHCKYGWGGSLSRHQSRRIALYLEQRR